MNDDDSEHGRKGNNEEDKCQSLRSKHRGVSVVLDKFGRAERIWLKVCNIGEETPQNV